MNLLAQSQGGGSHSKDRQHEKLLGISGLQDFGWIILSASVVNIAGWDKKLWCYSKKKKVPAGQARGRPSRCQQRHCPHRDVPRVGIRHFSLKDA